MKTKFEYEDLGESISMKSVLAKLKRIRKAICPDAVLVQRQTYGTDFPPFYAIESLEYHNRCNDEGEYTLIEKFED